ncbi:60S ribosomal protein L9B [Brettanomyces bruxellensis]|uniref:60S ribosomal protein L9B n=1 Tax=Dekkera bruxellensis TaxID=5007 RepID=A0A3F2XZY1_DEKBR|nr:60s ribosomal protein l9-b [Brettanomyces bruxellensis AWRI1499]KAF6010765.1 60S ribosomal protein L9B [Brettanomyces bruxellensis]KAF6013163.1 60S ribosomal protein L9B [Brettanomyces bruxellensis]VUG15921.1 RPL9B [Brettanomyces bruxellensis]
MKYVSSVQDIEIPKGVTVYIKSRKVVVKGPKGTLVKDLKHINVNFKLVNENLIQAHIHNGDRRHVATLRTVRSLITNMITGVTVGFLYKMRFVYAHFPINVSIVEEDGQQVVEIRNFLGDKRLRRVVVPKDVTAVLSKTTKDELQVSGISIEEVSQTCADIHQICLVRNKDIRKFLDGIFVSQKGHIDEDYEN